MSEPQCKIELDLEQWRVQQGLSNKALARDLGLSDPKLARADALGAMLALRDVIGTIRYGGTRGHERHVPAPRPMDGRGRSRCLTACLCD